MPVLLSVPAVCPYILGESVLLLHRDDGRRLQNRLRQMNNSFSENEQQHYIDQTTTPRNKAMASRMFIAAPTDNAARDVRNVPQLKSVSECM
jgi:hypothetical protein